MSTDAVVLPTWLVVVLAIAPSFAAGVTGLVIGKSQHRHEREQWTRDARLAAYVAFSDGCTGYGLAAWQTFLTPSVAAVQAMDNQQVLFGRARARVTFVGPASVSDAARQVHEALTDLNDAACGQTTSFVGAFMEVTEYRAFSDATDDFETEVAKHLGKSAN